MFVIDQDLELLDIIIKGPKVPMKKNSEGNNISKSKSEYNESDLKVVSTNYKAINQLCCALHGTQFNKVSSYTSANEI